MTRAVESANTRSCQRPGGTPLPPLEPLEDLDFGRPTSALVSPGALVRPPRNTDRTAVSPGPPGAPRLHSHQALMVLTGSPAPLPASFPPPTPPALAGWGGRKGGRTNSAFPGGCVGCGPSQSHAAWSATCHLTPPAARVPLAGSPSPRFLPPGPNEETRTG